MKRKMILTMLLSSFLNGGLASAAVVNETIRSGIIESGTVIDIEDLNTPNTHNGVGATGDILGGDDITIKIKGYDGNDSSGIAVYNDVDVVFGNNLNIFLDGGMLGSAIILYDGRATIGDNLSITVTNGEAPYTSQGIYAADSEISIGKNAVINVDSYWGQGLYCLGSNGIIEVGEGLNMTVRGDDSEAVRAWWDGTIKLNGGTIRSEGVGSLALSAGLPNYGGGTIEGNGIFHVYGDMKTESSGIINIDFQDESTFTGTANQYNNGTGGIDLTFNGSSRWNMTEDWNANAVMNGGHLYFNDPDFMTIRALGNLEMNEGTIHFDVDMAEERGDQFYVLNGIKGTGGYVDIMNNGRADTTGKENLDLLFDMVPEQAHFQLVNDQVDLGGYTYEWHSRTGENGERIWYLTGTGGSDKSRPTNPADAGVNIFSGSYLLNYAEMSTLLQRMGELRQGEEERGIWARIYGGNFKSKGDRFLRSFDMDYWGLQVGADKKIPRTDGKGAWYVGGVFGYSKGNLDYRKGSGVIDSKSIGAYGTYISKNGFYSDLFLKYGWMKNEFKVLDSAGDRVNGNDIHNNGLTSSLEMGYRYYFDNQNKEGWYIEPQGQIIAGHYSGDSFTASNGLRIKMDSYNSIIGRLGANIGYEVKGGENPINVYAKVSYVHEFDGDVDYYLNNSKEKSSFGGSWWTYGVGLTKQIKKKHNLYFDIERASGGNFTQKWQINGGYRFTW